ncbi:hypothetical protein EG347_18300 [Chryseobacterium sp. G0186]|nr:hypothetical protein EG347_18300 [Chryseobacterium sp. G0186]
MTHLDGIIKFYLQNETNNSLLITGDWGVGKTYYYKNILEKEIETFPTYFDNKKKYKSIVVSLFGISSICKLPNFVSILNDRLFHFILILFRAYIS